jgi:3-oxoacyl-[acyl-carrier protein] reductase
VIDANRRVLVTGSSGNLGSSICESFLQDGYSVVGVDIAQPSPSVDGTAPTPESSARSAWRFVACDLGDPASVKEALADAHSQGSFDIVVNNAGVIYNSPLLKFEGGQLSVHDADAWKLVLSGTLSSTFYVSAHCARAMVAAGNAGTIVNISSICAAGNAGQAAYSAAKAGVNAMTVTLAKELGPMGIRVAAIAPGFFDTDSTRRALSKDALSRIRKAIPLQKLGKPSQLYHAIRFIADNGYFHGKVLELDGGLTL